MAFHSDEWLFIFYVLLYTIIRSITLEIVVYCSREPNEQSWGKEGEHIMRKSKRENSMTSDGWKYKINDKNRKISSHRNAICTPHKFNVLTVSINSERWDVINEDVPSTLYHHHHHQHHYRNHYHHQVDTLQNSFFVMYSPFLPLLRLRLVNIRVANISSQLN